VEELTNWNLFTDVEPITPNTNLHVFPTQQTTIIGSILFEIESLNELNNFSARLFGQDTFSGDVLIIMLNQAVHDHWCGFCTCTSGCRLERIVPGLRQAGNPSSGCWDGRLDYRR
jgi:hypothetical protein